MSILKGVLQEEIVRLERNIKSYSEMLLSLPKGSIFIRKMGGSSFAYRKWKENGKVVSQYLGNINDANVQKQIELSNEYKRIKGNIRVAKQELLKLRKAYKIYEGERTTS